MIYTPPHTVSKDELIGTLLQRWRSDCPLALNDRPENVVRDLEFEAEEEQATSISTNGGEPTARLKLIRQYLNTAEKLDCSLTGTINLQQAKKDTGLLAVVLHTDERDPEQFEQGYFITMCH